MKRFTLYLTYFNDLMGYAIVFPIAARFPYFAMLLAVYAVAQWVSSSFRNQLSIKTRLVLTTLSYVLTGLGFLHAHIGLLLAGRLLGGLVGGISTSLQQNIAIKRGALIAGSLGLVAGPLLAGVLADENTAAWCSRALPFWIMAILSLINLVLVSIFYADNNYALIQGPVDNLKELWEEIVFNTRRQTLALICYLLAWFSFIQWMPVYLFKQFLLPESKLGFSLAIFGVGWCLGAWLTKWNRWVLLVLLVCVFAVPQAKDFPVSMGLLSVIAFCAAIVWNHMGVFMVDASMFPAACGLTSLLGLLIGSILGVGPVLWIFVGVLFFLTFLGVFHVENQTRF